MTEYVKLGREFGIDWNYILVKDITFNFGKEFFIPSEFKNQWFWIRMDGDELFLTVFKDYAWDGCTAVPDIKGTLIPSIAHDVLYQFSGALCKAWDWSLAKELNFANKIFKKSMKQTETNCVVKYTYFFGVVLFGYPFRVIKRFFASIF